MIQQSLPCGTEFEPGFLRFFASQNRGLRKRDLVKPRIRRPDFLRGCLVVPKRAGEIRSVLSVDGDDTSIRLSLPALHTEPLAGECRMLFLPLSVACFWGPPKGLNMATGFTVAVLLCALAIFCPARAASLAAPYPHSAEINEIVWHWERHASAAPGSDLWPVTWGPDGELYAAWGDGGGFGGSDRAGRVSLGFARISGGPQAFHGVNLNGGVHPLHAASFPTRGKTAGLLFVGDVLYALINLQDGRWPAVDHVLAWSDDCGATWTQAAWHFPKGVDNFQPAQFLNFGLNYAGVPPALSGFVYLLGPNQPGAGEKNCALFLARTPQGKLREQAALEYFAGTDPAGHPRWSARHRAACPVFSDANGVALGSISYNPVLQRFLLASFHTAPGQLGVFDAPAPWGPWTSISYEEHWGQMGAEGEGLTCSFPQKWMSADGLTLGCIFSAYGDGAKLGIRAHDQFNVVEATLLPAHPVKTP